MAIVLNKFVEIEFSLWFMVWLCTNINYQKEYLSEFPGYFEVVFAYNLLISIYSFFKTSKIVSNGMRMQMRICKKICSIVRSSAGVTSTACTATLDTAGDLSITTLFMMIRGFHESFIEKTQYVSGSLWHLSLKK